MNMKWRYRLLALALSVGSAWAAGPDAVARSDRSLWPEPLDSAKYFNLASRAEILVFAGALAEVSALDEAGLKAELHIKSADKASVLRVRDKLAQRLIENMRAARASCHDGEVFCDAIESRGALFEAAGKMSAQLPDAYRPWYVNAQTFHRLYAGELLRLAALFPKISSEIDTYSAVERDGFELGDGHFLLTFDDGPTVKGGTTDSLLSTLENLDIHGMFYVLGERLQARSHIVEKTPLPQRYRGQCVALHGWVHNSHQKWDEWQKSVLDTQALVKQTFPEQYRPFFRPPYGQRQADSGKFFSEHGLAVALWNIDSQDWNAKVSDSEAAQRVLSLMLLWRRGVILFHDIHPKAEKAVPWLVAKTQQSGISWDDCRKY